MSDVVCATGVNLLMDYLEGVLPTATVASVERHVAGCERCQAFVASYRATPKILRDATDIALPEHVRASLVAWLKDRRS